MVIFKFSNRAETINTVTNYAEDIYHGPAGADGQPGPQGPVGPGVVPGGTPGQILAKVSSSDYDTHWVDAGGATEPPIQHVQENGVELPIVNKTVNVTVPTVNDPTITIMQGSVTKGSFSLNQSTSQTITIDAGGGSQVQSDWDESSTISPAYIKNKPSIPDPQVQSDWDQSSTTSPSFIKNKPSIPDPQVQSDWNQTIVTAPSYIQNKPTIPTVNNPTITIKQGGVTKGSFTLNQTGDDTINLESGGGAHVQSNWTQTDPTADDYIKNKPTLHAVATSGNYNDLNNKPSIPDPQVQADWSTTDPTDISYIQNKPSIPEVHDTTISFTQGGVSKGSFTLNQSSPVTIALDAGSGTQIQSDWAQTDTTAVDFIKNKPEIPTVNNPTITFTQGGVNKGSITLNQSTSQTIALDAGGTGGSVTPVVISVPKWSSSSATVSFPGITSDSYLIVSPVPQYEVYSRQFGVYCNSQGDGTLGFTCSSTPNTSIKFLVQNFGIIPMNYLCFTANTSDSTVSFNSVGSPTVGTFQISNDKFTWSSYTPGSTITLTNVGDKVYFRGTGWSNTSYSNYMQFTMTGSIAGSGNVMTLIEPTYELDMISNSYQFRGLFQNCTSLTSAPELPAAVLTEGCYSSMFNGCTSLVSIPDQLPAQSVIDSCYSGMFSGCSSLEEVPVDFLPATSVTGYYPSNCFNAMFSGCTSLRTAPKLRIAPIKGVYDSTSTTYMGMFRGCVNLEQLPRVPGSGGTYYTPSSAYCEMFQGCTKIKLSTTQSGEYQNAWSLTWRASSSESEAKYMFTDTGGTWTGTPTSGTTYYTSNTIIE